MPAIDYVVFQDGSGWQVNCPGRYRGFFASEARAVDLATTLAALDAEDGRCARVVLRGPDGSLEIKWPIATLRRRLS